MDHISDFSGAIIAWQRQFGRHHLPWQCQDPYRIWVSEIMLQQTQVETVISFFERFVATFPTVQDLAAADFDQVAACWSGLGYYARARNLHQAARRIVEQYGGCFPSEASIWETLPGIGRSTAAAIAVFAFGRREAILDGNVKRVFSRVFAVETPIDTASTTAFLWKKAVELLPQTDIEAYTQGLMDLGASLCARRDPKCLLCPVRFMCEGCRSGNPARFPVKKVKPPKPVRETAFLILRDNWRVLLERRPEKGIWGNLWCFPEADLKTAQDDVYLAVWCETHFHMTVQHIFRLPALSHAFTHFNLTIWPIIVDVSGSNTQHPFSNWVSFSSRDDFGVPKPVSVLWNRIFENLKELEI